MSQIIPTIVIARDLVHAHGYDLAKTVAEDQRIPSDEFTGLQIQDAPIMWNSEYGPGYWTEVLNHLYHTDLKLGWMELDKRRTGL